MGFVEGISDFVGQAGDLFDTGGQPRNPPLSQTATSHAISLRTWRGIKIGRIQSWAPSLARTVDSLYEVQRNNTGEPIERVPQIQTTNTIAIERYELFSAHIGEAFDTPISGDNTDLYTLILQTKPLNVREVWRDPFGNIRAYMYVGCWFSDLGITIASNDDRIIKSRATLQFTRKMKLA